ncbi:MAG: MFS transporter [Pseudomonadota bacterium]|jgi:MFS family permease|uniref:Permeases of the major facilitator superfamily n=1 Tax=Caballeronia sordidicola TaxID=196367 RepID=A0A242MNX7_CABSO|nr:MULTISPECIES: MFS transporter [Burkholderiaceae]AMH43083.1 MFS transporter [Burkholderia sp. PAMC 26561]MDP9157543.1 MFS transporter [Pseudomonadota bacterium]OTP73028.1 Permeases of the major facilitator superfamily [Caballeronia sordidicola]
MPRTLEPTIAAGRRTRTPLNRTQIVGFWGAWAGWTLDGMDSFIYALVLAPALTELLPRSGYAATPANVGLAGSILFALFLVGWGLSFIWGPLADRFGRTKVLAATIFTFAIFTGLAATSHTVWELGIYRFLAGVGIGGEWALAGTYVAEAWPEDRRKMGAGYLQTGYYAGFFIAAALNYTIGATFGWRAMFLVGVVPVVVSIVVLLRVKETDKWQKVEATVVKQASSLRSIFSAQYRQRTIVATVLLTVAIIGLWAGAVYEPSAVIQLATKAGMTKPEASRMASIATGLLSIGTIVGCLALPPMAEKIGRRMTLAVYFVGMAASIVLAFGWAFYLESGLVPFIALLVVLGFFGGNFALFSLWLPEQFETRVRATAFAFCTSIGRFFGAIVNFGIGAMVLHMKTLGVPIALTAIAFVVGLAVIPFAPETKGQDLPH